MHRRNKPTQVVHCIYTLGMAVTLQATEALISKALNILDLPTGNVPEDFDKIPAGYETQRRKRTVKRG